ncbi:sensor domain-containing diguanylate cyclase [Agarilytica rhodophyticola]|uniref:sensor domain-containing diguanylate cyclase n=1 Tax=Agarilytica rhodophyticola TaxID=1737490 RepID=UPI000CD9D830|nr:sensor domain-containing diguanylate cyclase [Agarilytica rhodophyticola]
MEFAPIPSDDADRLISLERMNIIAVPREADFDRITRLVKAFLDVDACLITAVGKEKVWTRSCTGAEASELPRNTSMCGHTVAAADLFIIEDTLKDDRFFDSPLVTGSANIRFYAGMPIRNSEGHIAGTLCIFDNKPRELDIYQQSILRDFASFVEMAERARNLGHSQSQLLSQLKVAKRQALIDPLSKLWNRAGLDKLMASELALAKSNNESMAVLMIDLDHFKVINDTYGHAEGDNAIRLAAQILESGVRGSDIVARFGGEEFTILIRGISQDSVEQIGKNILSLFNEKAILLLDDGKQHRFTASIGISHAPALTENTQCEEILCHADNAVYKAKEKGRNCVVIQKYPPTE